MSKIISLYENFKNVCTCRVNEPMAKHTTFKVGGKADIILFPHSEEQIKKIILECKDNNIIWQVIGNGSNLLVKDEGIRGAVIVIGIDMNSVSFENDLLVSQAGASLSSVCMTALNNSLGGLEFAWGIPGNVGGAIFMNAGAYGGEMKDVVHSVEYLDEDGISHKLLKNELEFSYRKSFFSNKKCIITKVYFELNKADFNEIKAKMDDFINRRRDKQPLEFPSAGSTFKRPQGNFAGALIEQCGLKGYSIGDAQVSEKHAGFVINRGKATYDDISKLISYIQKTVFEKTGYKLECEVKTI